MERIEVCGDTTLFLESRQWDRDVLDYHRQLISIRHNYPALRTGSYKVIYAQGALYIFARILDAEELIIAVNAGTAEVTATIKVEALTSQPSKVLYGTGEISWSDEKHCLTINIPSRSGSIFSAI